MQEQLAAIDMKLGLQRMAIDNTLSFSDRNWDQLNKLKLRLLPRQLPSEAFYSSFSPILGLQ